MDQTKYTLIQKLQNQSDHQAWSKFDEIYGEYIVTVLKRIGISTSETEDLKQDILLKLWHKFPELEFTRGQSKFRSWLYKVIKNYAFNYFNARSTERSRSKRYFEEQHLLGETEEEKFNTFLHDEWKSYVAKIALQALSDSISPDNLEIFKKSIAGTSVKHLANEYGIKENTVYRIKNRVRDKLALKIAHIRSELE